jgi:hypothetical protein
MVLPTCPIHSKTKTFSVGIPAGKNLTQQGGGKYKTGQFLPGKCVPDLVYGAQVH